VPDETQGVPNGSPDRADGTSGRDDLTTDTADEPPDVPNETQDVTDGSPDRQMDSGTTPQARHPLRGRG